VDIIELGKLLGRASKFQPKSVWVIMNWRIVSHGSMKDAQNYENKGNKPNCSGYRIRAK
jgi:hypothetical protein